MEKQYATKAIVLASKNWRESDLLFSIFTEEFGLVEAMAVGSKKIRSKLAGHLSGLGIIELLFVRGKAFNKITHAYLIEKNELRDENDLYFAGAILEIIKASFRPEEKNQKVWELLRMSLPAIISAEETATKKLLLNVFLVRLLSLIGYNIKTDNCVRCGKLLSAVYRFNFSDHGFVCGNCSRGESAMSEENYYFIKKINLQQKNEGLRISKKNNDALLVFLRKYIEECLEKKINCFDSIIK
ncbi:DNA repair protein RecO [Patescibacteria group bacterium]|nr:DNA repair protein RecO [Patescibacteria group bacterium]